MGSEPIGKFERDDWGRLVLVDAQDRRYVGIDPVRAFPLSAPTLGISLCDETGREVVWVEDLDELPAETRAILEQEFASREFVPRILKIESISSESAPSDWKVLTDRGPTTFTLDSEESIRKLGKSRVLISDASGARFEIPNTDAIDSASRRRLDHYL